MQDIKEKNLWRLNGWLMVLIDTTILAAIALVAINMTTVAVNGSDAPPFQFWLLVPLLILFVMTKSGFFLIHPNEAKVFVFLGRYVGSCREPGFYWTNPFAVRRALSLRVRNFNAQTIKVNDASGNPIEIAAVVVWHVVDSAKARFNVENVDNFVAIQSETAIRTLASHFPYDAHEKDQESLRANPEIMSGKLREQVENRLQVAGVTVVETRLSHLAYAPEIAQVMLRRQQAEAIIAARQKIVDGAVGMVEMALKSLEQHGVVKLDEERKAAMVNNLLVALVSESEAQPIINTGTLYT
jgi:regulator of protease activity HflC (stomatin/prohibitin superfamily)